MTAMPPDSTEQNDSTAQENPPVIPEPGTLIPEELERPFEIRGFHDLIWLSKMLAHSHLVPAEIQGRSADIFLVLALGWDLGMTPMQSLRAFYAPEGTGRPELYTAAKVALVRKSPQCEYWRRIELTDEKAIYETKRTDDDEPVRFEYTLEMARAGGLVGKKNWKQARYSMLSKRCQSFLASDVYPEVVGGFDIDSAAGPPAAVGSYVPKQLEEDPLRPGAEALQEALAVAETEVAAVPYPPTSP